MTTRLADASLVELRLPSSQYQTTTVTKIRIFEDSAGGNWIWILAPLTAETANKRRGPHETGEIELEVEPLPDDDFRALEMTWLQENYSEIAAQYPGQWIAIDGMELVAHAADLATLLQISRQARHPNPFVTAIPVDPVTNVIL